MPRNMPVNRQVFWFRICSAAVAAALLLACVATPSVSTPIDRHTGWSVCDAAVLLDLALRAKQGDADAQYEEGLLLLVGHCVSVDEKAGLDRLRSAAASGHAEAAYSLGQLYGDDSLDFFDLSEAHSYLRIAALKGHVRAQHTLGLMLIRGGGTARTEKGLYWLGSAASAGHGLSALVVGRLHELGRFGIVRDVCLAQDWYEAGLLLGAHDAHFHLERLVQSAGCH